MTRKRIITYVDEEVYKKISDEAKKRGIKESPLIREKIEDAYKPKDVVIRRCLALNEIDDKYWCIWGRKGKPPYVKQLKDKSFCGQCVVTLELIERNEYLEVELSKSRIFELYICQYGGENNENERIYCKHPNVSGGWKSIEDFCVKRKCPALKKSKITVQGQLEEKDNR